MNQWTVHFVQPCGRIDVRAFDTEPEAKTFYAALPADWDKAVIPPTETEVS